jgi:hypothetical protein
LTRFLFSTAHWHILNQENTFCNYNYNHRLWELWSLPRSLTLLLPTMTLNVGIMHITKSYGPSSTMTVQLLLLQIIPPWQNLGIDQSWHVRWGSWTSSPKTK